MKIFKYLFPFLIFLFVIPAYAQWKQKDFNALKQLSGTWQAEEQPEYETWYISGKNSLSGKGYSVHGEDTVVNEYLQLQLDNKTISYTATVIRQNDGRPVTFRYTGLKNGSHVFENKEHDFPKTIAYRFNNKNRIFITLTGRRKDEDKTVQFLMSRINKR